MRTLIILAIVLIFWSCRTKLKDSQESGADTFSCKEKYDSSLRMSYYTEVDVKPSYAGGLQEMSMIISRNIKYPDGCPRIVDPKIVVECIISAEGKVLAKRILENFSGDTQCDAWADALKVVDHLKDWTPGQCQGKNVTSIFVFPIQYEWKE